MILDTKMSHVRRSNGLVVYRALRADENGCVGGRFWFPEPERFVADPNGLCEEILRHYPGSRVTLAFDFDLETFCLSAFVRSNEYQLDVDRVLSYCDLFHPIFQSAGWKGRWNKGLVDFAFLPRSELQPPPEMQWQFH